MSRNIRVPVALILLAGVVAVLILVLLPARDAKAPEPTSSQEQAQDDAAAGPEQVVAASIASGFQDRNFVDSPGATALAFLPENRLLVTGREGRVRLKEPGSTNTTVALDISTDVCSNSERGLLGIAVDPNFGTPNNNYVYLYYTYKKFGSCPEKAPEQNNPVNRVARFEMNGDTIVPNNGPNGPGNVLINNIPSPNGNHNAGDLHFGQDDKLYVSVGDGSCNPAAPTRCQPENETSRYRNVLNGKILRINTDGTVPADNPYANHPDGVRCGDLTVNNAAGGSKAAPGKVCKETYAMGFRNPFRFAIDPDTSSVNLRANDVGGGRVEEVDQVRSGGDYGWNCREGSLVLNTTPPCPGNDMTPPIEQYSHNTGCSSITGAAYVPNDAAWPSSYRDAYLFGDYVCGRIFKLTPNGNGGFTRTTFASGLQGGPVSFAFGPDGTLYYTTYSGGGQVRRVAFVENKSPIADIKATPTDETGKTFGSIPLTVNFNATGSSDPEGQNPTYEWDFGDTGSTDNTATGPTPTHIYDNAGVYTATLTARDPQDNTDTAKLTVYAGNDGPPQPEIESPGPENATFRVGQSVTLTGSATDDGSPVPGDKLDWQVIRHHTAPNEHTHPSILDPGQSTGESITFSAPGPEDLRSTDPDGNYLEVRLTATDSEGLSKTVTRDLKPLTTNVRFATEPSRLYLTVDGERIRSPRTLLAWENDNLNVYAQPQTQDGQRYAFRSWSDGDTGARRAITVPVEYEKYTATFRRR